MKLKALHFFEVAKLNLIIGNKKQKIQKTDDNIFKKK